MRNAVIAASTASDTPPRLTGALLRTQPDGRLAELAGNGSEAAFEEIVRRYRSGLVAFAGRISSRDSADDVVQDSMVKAHSALLRGDRPEAPRAWLFKIVRNTALNDRRDQRVHEHLDESYDGVPQPPEVAERRHQLRGLVAAMRELPRAQREALVQRELEGKGHEQIAASLDLSPGAVRQLIFRARSALRAGIGALLPMQLLRAAVLSGATEQAGPGAATGAGVAAKLGIGALITTGALFAGTHSVKERAATVNHHHAAVTASASPSAGAASGRPVHRTASVGASHRHQVIVTPKASSTQQSATPSPHPASPAPRGDHGGTGGNTGSTPPPSGSGGTGGGAYPDDGGAAQTYSAPSQKDCQNAPARDPGPGPVSPG
jgi:RNA polymerase sigma factor (sigma-70 family)